NRHTPQQQHVSHAREVTRGAVLSPARGPYPGEATALHCPHATTARNLESGPVRPRGRPDTESRALVRAPGHPASCHLALQRLRGEEPPPPHSSLVGCSMSGVAFL